MFRARFRGLSLYLLYQKGNLIRIKMGLDTYLIDNRQITHLICVRLKYLLYDFLGPVLGLLPVVSYIKGSSITYIDYKYPNRYPLVMAPPL